jgi:hypothetical protein
MESRSRRLPWSLGDRSSLGEFNAKGRSEGIRCCRAAVDDQLAVRLDEGINDELRGLLRYRGDLSKMALQALDSVDVDRVAMVSPDEPMVADTTISCRAGSTRDSKRLLKNAGPA